MNSYFSSMQRFRVPFVWALVIGVLVAAVISLPALVHGLFMLVATGVMNLVLIATSFVTLFYGVPALLNGQMGGLVWIFFRAAVILFFTFVWARMLGVHFTLFSWSSAFDALTALVLALALFFRRKSPR